MLQLHELGLLRVAAATIEHRVADVHYNCQQAAQVLQEAQVKGCNLVVLPELCLTGYTCGDLFWQGRLQEAVREALACLQRQTARLNLIAVVGAPLSHEGRLYNCAWVLASGRLLAVVPKRWLPNTGEFYEGRWFASGTNLETPWLVWQEEAVPLGTDLLLRLPAPWSQVFMGVELCEDLWVCDPPSGAMARAGASLLVNPSASSETLAKAQYRRQLVTGQSARCVAGYIYAGAGPGESSTDLVFSGHCLVAENGTVLAETERFQWHNQLAVADIDCQALNHDRLANSTFRPPTAYSWREVVLPPLGAEPPAVSRLQRPVTGQPFVPGDQQARSERCAEIFHLQTTALAKRLRHIGCQRLVVGISGGLDSTLALLVAVTAFQRQGWPVNGIEAVIMPGYGSTQRTQGNAQSLAQGLGVSWQEIPIGPAVAQHFADIGQDADCHDITYENAQARERTQILMDLANRRGALVLGTGDLSELALGWCTYNADHMSMYSVNCGVPKTLVRYLVTWWAETSRDCRLRQVLQDVAATPVSPELLPPDAAGEIQQKTEDTLGPYEVHDFFLYHCLRWRSEPAKIWQLACVAFAEQYSGHQLQQWLAVFYKRFFSQQFKRSCLPDGPKIGSVALSPRGDWRMPSDACAQLWLDQVQQLCAGG